MVCELKKEWKEVGPNTELVGTSRTPDVVIGVFKLESMTDGIKERLAVVLRETG